MSRKVKNPCKICFQTVSKKTGLQCQGACQKWAHFVCLNYTPRKIKDIKSGIIQVTCPCPDCNLSKDLVNAPNICTNTKYTGEMLSLSTPLERRNNQMIPTYRPLVLEHKPSWNNTLIFAMKPKSPTSGNSNSISPYLSNSSKSPVPKMFPSKCPGSTYYYVSYPKMSQSYANIVDEMKAGLHFQTEWSGFEIPLSPNRVSYDEAGLPDASILNKMNEKLPKGKLPCETRAVSSESQFPSNATKEQEISALEDLFSLVRQISKQLLKDVKNKINY